MVRARVRTWSIVPRQAAKSEECTEASRGCRPRPKKAAGDRPAASSDCDWLLWQGAVRVPCCSSARQDDLRRLFAGDVDAAVISLRAVGVSQVDQPAAAAQGDVEPTGGVRGRGLDLALTIG